MEARECLTPPPRLALSDRMHLWTVADASTKEAQRAAHLARDDRLAAGRPADALVALLALLALLELLDAVAALTWRLPHPRR